MRSSGSRAPTPTRSDDRVTDPSIAAALRASAPESLLPSRDQARAGAGTVDVVDALDLGLHEGAHWFLALVTIGGRLVVVPGRLINFIIK